MVTVVANKTIETSIDVISISSAEVFSVGFDRLILA